jgi:hypothetical protein
VSKVRSSLSYEAGFNVGMASFQTDYGERGDFQSGFSGNMGVAQHQLHFISIFLVKVVYGMIEQNGFLHT